MTTPASRTFATALALTLAVATLTLRPATADEPITVYRGATVLTAVGEDVEIGRASCRERV